MPPPHGFYPNGLNCSDDCRQAVVDEYDPDLIDEWSGGTSNRAYFYTSRGIAANMQFDYEMNQVRTWPTSPIICCNCHCHICHFHELCHCRCHCHCAALPLGLHYHWHYRCHCPVSTQRPHQLHQLGCDCPCDELLKIQFRPSRPSTGSWVSVTPSTGHSGPGPLAGAQQCQLIPLAHYCSGHPLRWRVGDSCSALTSFVGRSFSFDNGISVMESGSSEYSGYHSYTLDPLASRWRASLTASIARTGGFNDAMFQDNLANNLWSDIGGFSDEDNRLFIAAMRTRFSLADQARLGFPANISTFRIRDHLAVMRRAGHDPIMNDVVHEYTRWSHLQSMLNAVHSAEQMKAAAVAQNGGKGFPTAFYGNLPNAGGLHASVVMFTTAVDVIWSEQSEDFQPGFQVLWQRFTALEDA